MFLSSVMEKSLPVANEIPPLTLNLQETEKPEMERGVVRGDVLEISTFDDISLAGKIIVASLTSE
jgi:hypothetical protein